MDLAFTFSESTLHFLPQKAVWVEHTSSLFIADLHFGKAAHFRKAGIPIPEFVHDVDLLNIQSLIKRYKPTNFYILGDIFHSDWNSQWDVLIGFLEQFEETTFHLILGNHDILHPEFYQQSVLKIHQHTLQINDLILSHEPLEEVPEGKLNICGHIHPGVKLIGKARQSLRIPCFLIRSNQLTLPAFGHFTGLAIIKPQREDQILGVSKEKIIRIL